MNIVAANYKKCQATIMPMQGVHAEKVPGGKLLRIKVDYSHDENTIENVQVQGDFFIHPENFIDSIEQLLFNLDVRDPEESIAAAIRRLVDDEGAELIGITPEAIAKTFKVALRSAMNTTPQFIRRP